MPIGDKAFKVGDRVILMPGKGIPLHYATETKVSEVRRGGTFHVESLSRDFAFQSSGYQKSFGEQVSYVQPWTTELATEISRAKLAQRVVNKVARLSRHGVGDLSTDQLCRIEALLDKIAEERAKEGA